MSGKLDAFGWEVEERAAKSVMHPHQKIKIGQCMVLNLSALYKMSWAHEPGARPAGQERRFISKDWEYASFWEGRRTRRKCAKSVGWTLGGSLCGRVLLSQGSCFPSLGNSFGQQGWGAVHSCPWAPLAEPAKLLSSCRALQNAPWSPCLTVRKRVLIGILSKVALENGSSFKLILNAIS